MPAGIEQHAPGGRGGLQDTDAVVLDQGDQPLRIGHVRLGGHDQAGTATERQEQVEHRDVEGQGGDGQQRIVGLHAWRTRHRGSRLTTPRCVTWTPLGMPVEPEV
ncbi:hypothetical protein NG831_10645 [Xanthomonas sacchari]|nr:hypothetical protein [Xanthomonas sacchari]UYK68521.1 hypothetical protein NG831_10645 [Xanthomonas sacchari]